MTGSKIRIAYILTPITFGGAEKVSLNFLRNVDRENFDIQPILLVRPWEEETYFGRELRQIGYAYKTVPVALNKKKDPLRVPRVAHRLYSCIKNRSCDLVHTHGYFADICGLPAAHILNRSGISTCHGFIDTDFKLRLYNRLDKYALRLCKRVIAVSEMIKSELVNCGLLDSKITVVPNAVSPPCSENKFESRRRNKRLLLHIEPDEHVIGYLGRLSAEKGLVFLLEAVAEVLHAGRRIRLVIVGDGPEKSVLEQLVKAKGIDNKVIFTGFQTDLENWFPVFDIFVLPSLTEGTPLALLESMAVGLPVIASAVGGVPRVVKDGVNGLLMPSGNSRAIAEQMQLLMADPTLCQRLGRAGAETIRASYSLDSWCRVIEKCYIELLTTSDSSCFSQSLSKN